MMDITGIKGDIYQAAVVTRYELYKYIRNKRVYLFLGLIVLILALITSIPYLAGESLPQDSKVLLGLYLMMIDFIVIIGVAFFSSNALVSEFEERTALITFTRPVRKVTLFAGKFLASMVFCGTLIVLYYLVSAVVSLIVTGGVEISIFTSLGLALLYIAGVGGVAFMMSAIAKRGSTAAILTLLMIILILPMAAGIMMFSNVDPWFMLSTAGGAILTSITGADNPMMTIPGPATAAGVMLAWGLVTTFLAYFLFRRREF